MKNIDAVIVPVGGGGLIAGVALAVKTLKPAIEVIVSSEYTNNHHVALQGVEAATCASFRNAMYNEKNELFPEKSLADGEFKIYYLLLNLYFRSRCSDRFKM